MRAPAAPSLVAIVPAKDRADSIAATVGALRALAGVDRVVVVDDGSADATADAARAAGAAVLRLPANVGKGDAVAAGVRAAPDADVYLLVDADVGASAAAVAALVDRVVRGDADMAIGVLPAAGGRGGLGMVKRLAAAGIHRACGFRAAAPLSGQRAVRGDVLRSLGLAARFGLETALTIDAVRAGARVVEVPVAMEHRHTGRRLAGFRHRGRQGADIVRALWPRLVGGGARVAAIALATALLLGWMTWSGGRWAPASEPLGRRPARVVLFGMPHLGFADLGSGDTPNLDRLVARGALAAMSVRTVSSRPSTAEGYASLGAGTRVRAGDAAADARQATDRAGAGAGTARQELEARTRRPAAGDVVVAGYPATVGLNTGTHLSSEPGALGAALHAAGLRTAVVGNADLPGSVDPKAPALARPVAVALADRAGSVDAGVVDPATLLRPDPAAPFGHRFDDDAMVAATEDALGRADVVAVDPGDLDRASAFVPLALDPAGTAARRAALRRTDALLGRIGRLLPDDTLLLVVSVAPPAGAWRLTPMVAAGGGVPHGWVVSPSVKRLGVVTLTDVAPTVLEALGATVPDGMIGRGFRYHPGTPDLGALRRLDRDAHYRESIYFPLSVGYIVVQALLYLVALLVLARRRGTDRAGSFLRAAVVAIAAFPLATFVFRALPGVAALGGTGVGVLLAVDAAIAAVALRARRHPLSPLSWIVWLTTALIVVDVSSGARLQYSSLLGYSLHTAARFFGIGNTAFGALAASAALAAAIHVQYAPRRRDALLVATALILVVAVADGAPTLGDDVGGLLTLVPVLGLALVALWGRRLSWRSALAVLGVLVAALTLAVGADLLRPAASRTHLSNFVVDLVSGNGQSGTTIARKLATNVRVLGASVWTWMVPIVALFMLFLLVYEDRAAELLPRGSAVRTGVVSALAAGLVGFALNDSGVVVTAIAFVYLGPVLTLLALDVDRGEPVLLAPLPAPSPPGVAPRATVSS